MYVSALMRYSALRSIMSEFDIEQLAARIASSESNNYLSGVPLYECIRRELHSMILEGNYPDNCRLPSDKEIASILGVNTRTLAKALNELRDAGLLIRQRAKGTYINLASLESKDALSVNGNQVAVVFDDVNTRLFQNELFISMHKQLSANGFETLFASSSQKAEKQFKDVQAMFLKPDCCGCIFWSIMEIEQVQMLMKMKPRNFPLIILDKKYPEIEHDCVRYDAYKSGREAAQYYLEQGFQNFLFLAPLRSKPFLDLRIKGIRSVLQKESLKVIFHKKNEILDLNKYRRHAIIVNNTESLFLMYNQFQKNNFDLQKISPVAIFCTQFQILPPMPLLQVLFPASELGNKAVEILISRLRGDQSRPKQHLITHQSCTLIKQNDYQFLGNALKYSYEISK